MTLAEIPVGKMVTVQKVQVDEELSHRCFALGLRSGAKVEVVRKAPLGGPIHVRIGTTDIVIRQNLANLIKVL